MNQPKIKAMGKEQSGARSKERSLLFGSTHRNHLVRMSTDPPAFADLSVGPNPQAEDHIRTTWAQLAADNTGLSKMRNRGLFLVEM